MTESMPLYFNGELVETRAQHLAYAKAKAEQVRNGTPKNTTLSETLYGFAIPRPPIR